ncbi:hypothetical protein HanPSC8_Chr03g0085151 [Helianthus annuus]|nr:hypothetical protein HanPSC8_Chr03g0085151 [Helianthus annuus]
METKYVVTAHVHAGKKLWRIPVPINFLAAGLHNHLVFYWTGADDCQRSADSLQKTKFKFSFSVEPRDCNLQVTKFGGRFIQESDIMLLKYVNRSTTNLMEVVFKDTLAPPSDLLRYMGAYEAVTFLRSCHSSINHDLCRSIAFIYGYRKKQHTLVHMHEIVERLIKMNQEVLSECKEVWSHTDLFPLVYDYYGIIHETSRLYNEFLRLLKDAANSWLSVKLALEQIMARSRTENDYSYKEMLEQLDDLEAAKGIRFCDHFFKPFASISKRIVAFSRNLNDKIQDIKNCKLMITLAKASSITITCLLSILSTYICTDKQSQLMEGASSYPMWLDLIGKFYGEIYGQVFVISDYGRELHIWDFLGTAVVVEELKMKMAQFASFTCQSNTQMMIVINKLENMMDNISVIIEDMRRHAHLYSLDIRSAGNTLNQFIVDSKLHLSVTGVQFMPPHEEQQNKKFIVHTNLPFMLPNEDQKKENSVSEALTIMYRATSSIIHTGLHKYIHACEEADSLFSGYFYIRYNIQGIIRIIRDPGPTGGTKSLNDIREAITCLHAINRTAFKALGECKEGWSHVPQLFHLVDDYHNICLQTSKLYNDFVRLLKDKLDSQLSVGSRLEKLVESWRQAVDHQDYEEVIQLSGHIMKEEEIQLSGDFMKSLACICEQTVAFIRQFEGEILELKSVKPSSGWKRQL